MTLERAEDVLGLRTGSRLMLRALDILRKPWRLEESTAQPSATCGHARIQFQTQHRPQRWVCSACGWETGWRPSGRAGDGT